MALYITMMIELGGVVAVLVLFALAQPDTYRTELWQAGYQLGFNSSPNVILYALANFKPLPDIAFVWTERLTDFNVAISVISLFVLFIKMIGVIMHVFHPIFSLVTHLALAGMYATSMGGQAGSDYLDPDHPSSVAWYIAKPCTAAANQTIQGYCKMAKITFAFTCIMFFINLAWLGLTIWAMLPNERDKRPDGETSSDSDDEETGDRSGPKGKSVEMEPQTPRTVPFTPRTTAFKTLERKLPLRT